MSIYRHEGNADCMISRGIYGAYTQAVVDYIRALIYKDQYIYQLPVGEESTGKKPLVLVNGTIQERISTEGLPIVWDGDKLRTLDTDNETLLI